MNSLDYSTKTIYIIGALSLFDCRSSVPRRESTGRQYIEKLLPQSRGSCRPNVSVTKQRPGGARGLWIGDKRITRLATG